MREDSSLTLEKAEKVLLVYKATLDAAWEREHRERFEEEFEIGKQCGRLIALSEVVESYWGLGDRTEIPIESEGETRADAYGVRPGSARTERRTSSQQRLKELARQALSLRRSRLQAVADA